MSRFALSMRQASAGLNALAAIASPSQISGLFSWYDASALGLANNASISSWADASGNGRTLVQTTSSKQPTYLTSQQNGLAMASFNATNSQIITSSTADTAEFANGISMTFIARLGSTTGRYMAHGYYNGGDYSICLDSGNDAKMSYIEQPGYGVDANSAITPVIGTNLVITGIVDSVGNSQIRRNGAVAGTKVANATLATNATGGFHIGGLGATVGTGAGGDQFITAYIGEVIRFNRAISSSEATQLERYLGTKWGISVL